MSIGQRLRQLRESRGLTQRQLAAGKFSKSYISLIEHDRARPSIDTLAIFAGRLGTTIDGIVAQEGHAPDAAAQALLSMAWDAAERRDEPALERLVGMIQYVVDGYKVQQIGADIALLMAQRAFTSRDYDRAVEEANRAKSAAESDGDMWRAGRALTIIGRSKLRQREFAEAVDSLTAALDALRRSRAGRDPARTEALIALGTSYSYQGNLKRATDAFVLAAASYIAKRNPKLLGRALWGLGLVRRKQGRLGDAIEQLQSASKVLDTAEEPVDRGRVMQNLGQVYLEMGKPKLALRQLEHALRIFERMHQPIDRASTMTEIARTYIMLGDLNAARKMATAAIAGADQAGDVVEVAEANVVLGRSLLKMDRLKPAVSAITAAINVFRERGMALKLEELGREFGLHLHERGAHAEASELLAAVLSGSLKK
ncbi:MAG TPA: tetratricopeptide repeat protein [bacterium]|nr:tetratricopeptide repeat protein [bacterium]